MKTYHQAQKKGLSFISCLLFLAMSIVTGSVFAENKRDDGHCEEERCWTYSFSHDR